jgi:hypothetical protein
VAAAVAVVMSDGACGCGGGDSGHVCDSGGGNGSSD